MVDCACAEGFGGLYKYGCSTTTKLKIAFAWRPCFHTRHRADSRFEYLERTERHSTRTTKFDLLRRQSKWTYRQRKCYKVQPLTRAPLSPLWIQAFFKQASFRCEFVRENRFSHRSNPRPLRMDAYTPPTPCADLALLREESCPYRLKKMSVRQILKRKMLVSFLLGFFFFGLKILTSHMCSLVFY